MDFSLLLQWSESTSESTFDCLRVCKIVSEEERRWVRHLFSEADAHHVVVVVVVFVVVAVGGLISCHCLVGGLLQLSRPLLAQLSSDFPSDG